MHIKYRMFALMALDGGGVNGPLIWYLISEPHTCAV